MRKLVLCLRCKTYQEKLETDFQPTQSNEAYPTDYSSIL